MKISKMIPIILVALFLAVGIFAQEKPKADVPHEHGMMGGKMMDCKAIMGIQKELKARMAEMERRKLERRSLGAVVDLRGRDRRGSVPSFSRPAGTKRA